MARNELGGELMLIRQALQERALNDGDGSPGVTEKRPGGEKDEGEVESDLDWEGKSTGGEMVSKEVSGEAGKEAVGEQSKEGVVSGVGDVALLLETIQAWRNDLARWRVVDARRRKWWVAGLLGLAAPGALVLGLLAQKEFEVVPVPDRTGGWKDHVWERGYGPKIADCVIEAKKQGKEIVCKVTVRAP